jgi:tRNA threonylcarbamoyladenosine biosynthesis protein TsaE
MKKIIVKNEEEMILAGKKLAKKIKKGTVFGLIGGLGSGKTTFSKGLAKGLEINDTVNSPTFNIMKIYKVKNNSSLITIFCHIDAYRLSSVNDLAAIGALEYFNRPDVVSVIEWSDKVAKALPRQAKIIRFITQADGGRLLSFL